MKQFKTFGVYFVFHDFECKVKKVKMRVMKQNEGYGLRCHRAIITLCKLIGIKDLYCKQDGSCNLLNITRAFFSGLVRQETFQELANRKQLHVVEFQPNRGPLPIVVASPQGRVRLNPEPVDEILDVKLNWKCVQAKEGKKPSKWADVKHNIW